MLMLATCFRCLDLSSRQPKIVFYRAELHDTGVVVGTCPNGHGQTIIVQNHKFELLFESGGLALLDGHTREAVSSFHAALERFYEFYIRVIGLKHNIPSTVMEKGWKEISNQSERQYGAFCALYLLENKSAFHLDEKLVRFRNDVIHKGYMPGQKKVIDYAGKLLSIMTEVSRPFLGDDREWLDRFVSEEQTRKAHAAAELAKESSLSGGGLYAGTILFDITFHSDENADDFETRLRRLADLRQSVLQA